MAMRAHLLQVLEFSINLKKIAFAFSLNRSWNFACLKLPLYDNCNNTELSAFDTVLAGLFALI